MLQWPLTHNEKVVGLREAARRFKDHGVTEAAARKRSQREGWAQDGRFGKAKTIVTTSPPAATAAQVMAVEMSGLSGKTRLSHARAQARVAEHVEGRTGAENLDDAQNVKAAAQTANLVFGWSESVPAVRVRLDILNVEADQAPNWDEWQGEKTSLETTGKGVDSASEGRGGSGNRTRE